MQVPLGITVGPMPRTSLAGEFAADCVPAHRDSLPSSTQERRRPNRRMPQERLPPEAVHSANMGINSGRMTRDSERAALRDNIGSDVAIARPPGDAAHHNPCLAFGPRIQTLGISVLFVVAGQCTITPYIRPIVMPAHE